MIQNEEFIRDFVEEASSHIEIVEKGLLTLEEGVSSEIVINDIFRSIHSIKGTAGFFGLGNIVKLSHKMENILGDIRSEKIAIHSAMVDALLSANDCLKEMLKDVSQSETMDIDFHTQKLTLLLEGNDLEGDNKPQGSSTSLVGFNTKEQMLQEAIRHGQKLFRVSIDLKRDIDERGISPIKFFKKIQSIGTIIDTYTDMPEIEELEDVLNTRITFTFLFTTVLEKNLLPTAIDLPEDAIEGLDISNAKEKIKELLKGKDRKLSQEPFEIKKKNAVNNTNSAPVIEDSIRVHVNLLNSLLNLSSEMVLGRNQLIRSLEGYRKEIQGLDGILQNIDRITTELQERIMQTRMQPVGNVFNKMPRVVRDLSKKLGKEVELKINGSEVELDKSIIECLSDPLTHLVRNALDHGIEIPAKREKTGKSKTGIISLKAYHEGGHVYIDIIDDGGGIPLQRVKEKAFEKGIATAEEIRDMGEQETLQLLFKPGFSTADEVTDISGRGVGMDVVKTNIEKLGGAIEVYTKEGEGTNFRLVLPLTLAIIPSLIVGVGDQRFALPKINLQEMVRIKKGDQSKKIESLHDAQVLRLRGKLLPIIYLSDILGMEKGQGQGLVTRVLVLKIGNKKFGLIIDEIYDEEEILVKPLPPYFKSCQCYSGVTILGDGKTAMILDPSGIVEKGALKFIEEEIDKIKEHNQRDDELIEQQNLIIFKCSGQETFAIDLSLVARVEEITWSDIEQIGEKSYIQYRGDSLRVIRPEDFLPVSKEGQKVKKLYVIIPKLVHKPIGMLIEKIEDTVMTNLKMSSNSILGKGIVGSTILKERIVLLINMYEIFEMADPSYFNSKDTLRPSKKSKVLLVEDTPFFAKLERDYLESVGYEVYYAENGAKALDILRDNPIDAVISDIEMPVMDGIQLIKNIRKDKKLAHLPVIAVTSMTGEGDRKRGLESGFDDYQFKLDKIKLLEALDKVLPGRDRK